VYTVFTPYSLSYTVFPPPPPTPWYQSPRPDLHFKFS
jgi:hypothetical protein